MLLDFDGSLAGMVAHPELARPVEGAREALAALVQRFRVVAIVSGRRSAEVESLIAVPGIVVCGLYGLDEDGGRAPAGVSDQVDSAVAPVQGAWVEHKGPTLAVHYRRAPNPGKARSALVSALRPIAAVAGLEIVEGKMVVELVPAGRPRKGGVVERLLVEHDLSAALFAGDDVADLEAFGALDRAAERGALTVKVAVRGPETPAELVRAADLTVEGPPGLVELLRRLV